MRSLLTEQGVDEVTQCLQAGDHDWNRATAGSRRYAVKAVRSAAPSGARTKRSVSSGRSSTVGTLLDHTARMGRARGTQEHDGLRSERLRLRPWTVADAAFRRRLWAERDPRVPAGRRLTADGSPSLADMEAWILGYEPEPTPGLLVVELVEDEAPIGYCGLVRNSVGRSGDPELAFEFLRTSWGHGYATEAARAVVARAAEVGHEHLVATVREWNTASLTVLGKLGFVDTGEREHDPVHGDSLLLRARLR
ncbi:GNAT family N-acetyltransferase [Curtobacterium sp. B8]|uniref:GNAT family N-acetyltransferase n=1 Tax=Curtobacterium sp. B8 TaxID=95611 RepID=UPI0021C8FFA0|nr:GNAT family N-acetyltransferase [Curtobacterium sp. B8]